jgi:hypothetical protein
MYELSDINNGYVFIHTKKENIIRKIKNLTSGLNFSQFGSLEQENGFSGIFYKNSFKAGSNVFYSIDKLNDLEDYELKSLSFNKSNCLDDQFDSLISYCFIKDISFIAGTDYLSILNHFYYYDKDTFICSNNMFIVANLCNDSLSETALFETLFFRFPFRNNTYFNSVRSLNPYQQLLFTEKDGLSISSSVTYNDLLLTNTNDISTDIKLFFSKLNRSENLPPLLSFSGGSDSVAILSVLKQHGLNCQLASFKGHSEWDTIRIKNLARKAGYPLLFIDTDLVENSIYDELQYTFMTNGFSPSVHFYNFYKTLPQKFQIFDGYSMMLGDWSDAFLNPPYRSVLQGIPIDSVFETYFAGFDPLFIKRMKDYLITSYKDQFLNINTSEGLQNMRQYAVEFITSKILSGVLKCSINFHHQNVSFFLSRKFISYIEKNGYGIALSCSARNDYPGYAINRKPRAEIVHKMDKMIYRLRLDHGLSCKDINEAHRFLFLKKKVHLINKKLFVITHQNPSPVSKKENISIQNLEFIDHDVKLNPYAISGISVYNNTRSLFDKIGA